MKGGARSTGAVVMLTACLLILSLLGPAPSMAQDVGTPAGVLAPPDGANNGFAPNNIVIAQGGSVDVVGADLQSHNLACIKRNRKTKLPLCQSEYAAAGETKRVEGVENLKAGAYQLMCQLHPSMIVDLTVL